MVDPEGHPHGTVRVSDSTMSELRRSSQQCALIVRRHLETGGSEDVVARAADQIAKLLVLRISRACEDGQEPVRIQRSAALVAKAQELLDTREDPAMGLTDICHGLGVGLRTLNYAFREATGEPPARWLRAKRLNSVRKRLLSEEGTKMLIKQVAFEHGFLHLGRFSGQYRMLFGELPTDTVAARARLASKTTRGALT